MKENSDNYSEEVRELAKNPKHFGRMNDPSASAYLKGICGDDMEFYLLIKDKTIEDIMFYTETGCEGTKVCGSIVAQIAIGKPINEAMDISPNKILEALNYGLHENHHHCAILAASTFYKAITYFLLKH
ncbi:MAG: iron-sulfur cluster assembly scaffold protein [Elusimicrobia bacterium]|nr:iron-sulfur cluster assembly scaffold protein [Elusimicrobiota bacterium]